MGNSSMMNSKYKQNPYELQIGKDTEDIKWLLG
jgi:hypothetical protein